MAEHEFMFRVLQWKSFLLAVAGYSSLALPWFSVYQSYTPVGPYAGYSYWTHFFLPEITVGGLNFQVILFPGGSQRNLLFLALHFISFILVFFGASILLWTSSHSRTTLGKLPLQKLSGILLVSASILYLIPFFPFPVFIGGDRENFVEFFVSAGFWLALVTGIIAYRLHPRPLPEAGKKV